VYANTMEIQADAETSVRAAHLRSILKDNGTRFFERILGRIAHGICGTDQIRIAQIDDPAALEKLWAARLTMYRQRDSYLDKLTNADGSDDLDSCSYLFAAYLGDTIIGSVRLTPPPFEASKYIEREKMQAFLGTENFDQYLEMSRLVIDGTCRIRGLSRALIVYAGLLTSLSTRYERYMAIARPEIAKRSFSFLLESDKLSFRIPERGDHEYNLIKGSFAADFYDILSRSMDVIKSGLEAGRVADAKTFYSF
jgi:hypothetical protein